MTEQTTEDVALRDLTVIVLSHNRKTELQKILPPLCETSRREGLEVIIVDNASTDGSREFLEDAQLRYPGTTVVYNTENHGVAEGRNIGWRLATRRWILNIDDDVYVSLAGLRRIMKYANSDPMVGIVSPRIVHATTGRPQCDHGDTITHIANFHGACHAVRREAFLKVGELDSQCSFGGEELDYSIRSRTLGYSVVYAPVTTVKHNNIERCGIEGEWRRKQWVYNFTRVLFKHFPVDMAFIFSLRYLLLHLASGFSARGFVFATSLIVPFVKGVQSGRREYRKAPDHTVDFYRSSEIRPEFGNVPILKKIISHCRSTPPRSRLNTAE